MFLFFCAVPSIFLSCSDNGNSDSQKASIPDEVKYKTIESWSINNKGSGKVIVIPDSISTERGVRKLGAGLTMKPGRTNRH